MQRSFDVREDMTATAIKASPPVLVSMFQQATAAVPDFIQWATAVYIVIQIALAVRKWRRDK